MQRSRFVSCDDHSLFPVNINRTTPLPSPKPRTRFTSPTTCSFWSLCYSISVVVSLEIDTSIYCPSMRMPASPRETPAIIIYSSLCHICNGGITSVTTGMVLLLKNAGKPTQERGGYCRLSPHTVHTGTV